MIQDARQLSPESRIDADVCVIGAGAAGISLARALDGGRLRVCLLESGGLEADEATAALNAGESVGQPYFPLAQARLRFLGGTTNHWAGWCRPLDEIDFEQRAWVPHSGWPFGRLHLMPWYARAQRVCGLGPFTYRVDDWRAPGPPPISLDAGGFATRVFQLSAPLRFGSAYRDELERSSQVHTLLYANAVALETDSERRAVQRVHCATLSGRRFSVVARRVVLAAGAIENARILLESDLGNQHDRVGRYFMDHVECPGALLLPTEPTGLDFYRPHPARTRRGGARVCGVLASTPESQREERLTAIASTELQPVVLRHQPGDQRAELARSLAEVVSDVDGLRASEAGSPRSALPKALRLSLFSEQVPNPASRITLSGERDALGQRRVRLDWRVGAIERRSIREGYARLALAVGRAGIGRLRIDLPRDEQDWTVSGQWHQLGTTRMHEDPRHGVVDAHCRVHGVDNLFVAGGSVFPTSGTANPTLTLVALALRLADRLQEIAR